MKHLNVVVFLIAAAAVLVAAYAVGLLVRQARTTNVEPAAQPLAGPNAPAGPRINRSRAEPTPEERAALKDRRAQQLARMQNATEQEKQEFKDRIREQFAGGAESRTPTRAASPTGARSISPRPVTPARPQEGAPSQPTTADANEAGAAGEEVTEERTSEPNTGEQN